ncbi:sugar ABC transporter substrate-binding protein [Pusillimonas sp. T2]|nr:sugar ABC transporter substrate-binding protein [Pusillimonas sp. T2]
MTFAFVGALSVNAAHAADSEDRFQGLIEPIKAEKSLSIGVTLVHLHDDFWKGIAYGIEDEAKRSGVELVQVSVAGAYGNVREQFAQLEALKTLGVDYAVIGAASFNGYDPIFRQLNAAGTKVLAVGIPVNSPNVTFGVGQDETSIGQVLAKEVCQKDPNATVITIPGPAGAEWTRLRYVGFTEEAKKCNGLKVLDGAFRGNVGLSEGMAQASDLLLRNPEAKFIYTPEISLGMGAAQAVRQQKRDVQVVSSSVVREAIPMVKDGRFLGIVSEPGIIMGRLIVQYAIRENEGKEMPSLINDGALPYPYVLTPPELIKPDNVDIHPYHIYEIPPADWSIKAIQ